MSNSAGQGFFEKILFQISLNPTLMHLRLLIIINSNQQNIPCIRCNGSRVMLSFNMPRFYHSPIQIATHTPENPVKSRKRTDKICFPLLTTLTAPSYNKAWKTMTKTVVCAWTVCGKRAGDGGSPVQVAAGEHHFQCAVLNLRTRRIKYRKPESSGKKLPAVPRYRKCIW